MYIVHGRKPLSSGEETIAPAVGAPVLSLGAGFVSDREMKLGGKENKEKNKEGHNTNTREEKVSSEKIEEQKRVESDIAAAVQEAADNVVARGKGKGKGEGSMLGSASATATGKGKEKSGK
ncbi:hypothetical protein BELL_0753g00010 [Botrytis elliptica]|uniref:Uncharacterized protein n=1 Tax=Botrytis elliptica TaxID=278938 RepID=A0A4Z1J9D5_9HELO|nr:hypothetical protein BELL_0753g00010 [Botrytis elliptica]